MKRVSIRLVFACILITASLLSAPAYSSTNYTGRQMAELAIASLKAVKPAPVVTTTRNVPSLYWTWYEVNFNNSKEYPITVDFLGSNFSTASKIVYMLPGGGMNFRASFLTPIDDNLAQYFRKSGYLVVGITPREDNVPTDLADYGFMKAWDMDAHLQDIMAVIKAIQANPQFMNKHFRVLGHSFGAAYALDYGSKCSSLNAPIPEKVEALDIYSFARGSEESSISKDSYDIFSGLTQTYVADSSYADLKSLMLVSSILPYVLSPESYQESYNHESFTHRYFTYEGFLYYSMINSTRLDSVMLGDWPLQQGYVAGTYKIPDVRNPYRDTYSLDWSSMVTLKEASLKIGSGLVPLAVYRDFFGVNGYVQSAYFIDWSAFSSSVLWMNNGKGYNKYQAGAGYLKDWFKKKNVSCSVETYVISNFGHLDILSNNTRNKQTTSYGPPNWYLLTYPDYPTVN